MPTNKVKVKCRNNNCLRTGDFTAGNGLCPKCVKLISEGFKKKKKPITKTSSKSYPKALREAKQAFQKLRRLEESDKDGICYCVNGEIRNWTKCDGGHYFPATKLNTCFCRMNVHPQGKRSNQNMNDPDILLGYKAYLIDRYGHEAYNDLERKSKMTRKYSVFELEQLKLKFEQEIEKILRERNWK